MSDANYSGYICKICGQEVKVKKHFWLEHKISESSYFQEYEPRFDLLTEDRISFKSYDSYVCTNFTSRVNLKKYLAKLSEEDVFKYLVEWISKRKTVKSLEFAPSEFELKTLQFPMISYLNKKYGGDCYSKICKAAGLKMIYDYNPFLGFSESEEIEFLVDTREQSLLKLKNFQIKKLDYGDYSINGSKLFIERKSLNDLCGTISQGYDRFSREIDRCVADGGYLVILVEEKQAHLEGYPFLPHTKHIKAEPVFIQHRIRELLLKYPTSIQFLAVDGIKEASRVIERVFRLTNDVKTLDLQFLYNNKEL